MPESEATAVGPRVDLPASTVVTGAAGWLGRALVAGFTDVAGAHHRTGTIRCVDLVPPERVGGRVEVVKADVRDPAALDRAFAGLAAPVDVIHTAGVIHPARVADFAAVNTAGTVHVLEAAQRAGVRRVVHVSSNSPFGTNPDDHDTFRSGEPYNPSLGYGQSKMDAELAVYRACENGLDAVIVRPPWFYGPWQPPRQTTFFKLVRRGRFPQFGSGAQRRSMVYIENLVQGVALAELSPGDPGRAWWIADVRPYTVREIVDTVGRALVDEGYDVAPPRLRLPVVAGRVAEAADRLLQRRGIYHQRLHVLGEMAHSIAVDIAPARSELGYQPAYELYEGMRRSIAWCRLQGIEL